MAILSHTFSAFWRDVKNLYKPYAAFSFFFFPCAINMYGIIKFKNLDFYANKSVNDAKGYLEKMKEGNENWNENLRIQEFKKEKKKERNEEMNWRTYRKEETIKKFETYRSVRATVSKRIVYFIRKKK